MWGTSTSSPDGRCSTGRVLGVGVRGCCCLRCRPSRWQTSGGMGGRRHPQEGRLAVHSLLGSVGTRPWGIGRVRSAWWRSGTGEGVRAPDGGGSQRQISRDSIE